MPIPTIDELTEALRFHLDAPGNQIVYVKQCVEESVSFIGTKIRTEVAYAEVDGYIVPASTELVGIPEEIYSREVVELGADLFYRRQAKNGVVSVNTMEGMPMRIANDPWKASEQRLARFTPLGFA